MKKQRTRTIVVLATLALTLGACGGGDDEQASQGPQANEREQAFLQGMIPHHESAIEMAKVAQEKGERPEIKKLAGQIVSDQQKESEQIKGIYRRLYNEEVKPDAMAHEKLGVSAEKASMGMDAGEMTNLENAKPFDRAFIDAMVPHHQGAIRMARVAMKATKDQEVMRLARTIIDAQSFEITEMNAWRKQWYGAASPAGGIPSEKTGGGGGHSGMDM